MRAPKHFQVALSGITGYLKNISTTFQIITS